MSFKRRLDRLEATAAKILPQRDDTDTENILELVRLDYEAHDLAPPPYYNLRELYRNDLWSLLVYGCNRGFLKRSEWFWYRIHDVQNDPWRLFLWAREHGKSTIVTFGFLVQQVLATHGKDSTGEEKCICIFSHTRPIAKAFLRTIKWEFELNKHLISVFPDILWSSPFSEAIKWSENEGICVKRESRRKESTVEAFGLVDGQPTGMHFDVLAYDDVVVLESVASGHQIARTVLAFEHSLNLGVAKTGKILGCGTRYHVADAYGTIIDRETITASVIPGTEDGSEDGKGVLWDDLTLRKKRRDLGPYTFSSQILLRPIAEIDQHFERDWLQFYDVAPATGNDMILVDPASEKKKDSTYTAMMLVRLASDAKYYILDMVLDKLSLPERIAKLFEWHKKNRKSIVGYEQYAMQADIAAIQVAQERDGYRFQIKACGGNLAKGDRIRRLVAVFERGDILLPRALYRENWEKKTVDLVQEFLAQEYTIFPANLFAGHADMLDCLSRLVDLKVSVPTGGRPTREARDVGSVVY